MIQGQALEQQEQSRGSPVTWVTDDGGCSQVSGREGGRSSQIPGIRGREHPHCLMAVIRKANRRKGIGGRDGRVLSVL